jgi:hypothetical protein
MLSERDKTKMTMKITKGKCLWERDRVGQKREKMVW